MQFPARVLALGLALTSLVAAPAAQEPVARVEVTSYKQLAADVATMGTQIQNPMLNMTLLALGNVLGAPGLLGIDQERPIRVVLFADAGNLPNAESVLLLPVLAEGKAYLDGLKASYTSIEDDGTLRRFRANRPVQSFREMSVRIVGGFAVVGPSTPLVQRTADWLQNDAERLAVGGISGSVRLALDATAILPALRQRVEEQARAAEAGGVAAEAAAALADMMRLYAEAALGMLEQTQSVKLGLQCNDSGLTIYARIDTRPETTLAKMCAEARPPAERFRRLLPADAVMTYATGAMGSVVRYGMGPYMTFVRRLMDVQQRMVAQLGQPGLPAGFNMDAMLAKATELVANYGDDLVISVGPGANGRGFVMFEAVAVKDGAKILQGMDENLELANTLYAQMPMPIKIVRRDGRTVDGCEVRTYGVKIVPPAPAAKADPAKNKDDAEPDAKEVQRMMQEAMVEQLAWLEKGVVEFALVDNVLLLTMGAPGSLDPFVARLRNPPEDVWTARSQALFPDIRNHAQAVELWNLKLLAMVKGIVPLFDKEGEVAGALAQLPTDGDGMGGLTIVSPTAAMGAFRISATQLGAIVRSAQTLQGIGRQVDQGARPPEAPRGDPVNVVLPEN